MPARALGRRLQKDWGFAAVVALRLFLCHGFCNHEGDGVEPDAASGQNHTILQDGRPVFHEIPLNMTRHYYYENFNVTTMGLPNRYRKLILSLEPCEGVVYLFVRKTRRCWPDPRSCCRALQSSETPRAPPCNPAAHKVKCSWTHFHSVLDGSRDGAPTFFEVPLGSTKYYISVFAPQDTNLKHGVTRPQYRLMALTDVGAYPRPGLMGRIKSKQVGDMAVELTWEQATFVPMGVSALKRYHVYSSLMLAKETKTNEAVFLSPQKVMNSACGLDRNAVRYGNPLTTAACDMEGVCRATISGVVPRRRYMFNVVSESYRGFNSTYSGIVVSADWTETAQLLTDSVVGLIGAVCGTVFGVVVIGYLWIVKLYK